MLMTFYDRHGDSLKKGTCISKAIENDMNKNHRTDSFESTGRGDGMKWYGRSDSLGSGSRNRDRDYRDSRDRDRFNCRDYRDSRDGSYGSGGSDRDRYDDRRPSYVGRRRDYRGGRNEENDKIKRRRMSEDGDYGRYHRNDRPPMRDDGGSRRHRRPPVKKQKAMLPEHQRRANPECIKRGS